MDKNFVFFRPPGIRHTNTIPLQCDTIRLQAELNRIPHLNKKFNMLNLLRLHFVYKRQVDHIPDTLRSVASCRIAMESAGIRAGIRVWGMLG